MNKPTNNTSTGLSDIRTAITGIDNQLLELLSQRRQLSQQVAKQKRSIDKALRDQNRERELLEALIKKASNKGLDSHYIQRIFNTIIEDSVQYQQDYMQSLLQPELKDDSCKSLAVLGGKGAYSYLAAKKFFSNSKNDYLACDSFDQVFETVIQEHADYGVLPIENTTSGGITEVYDLLLDSNLSIIGEEKYAVNHCLVAPKGCELKQITQIAAHPEAGRQCSQQLKQLVSAKIKLVESTAHALEMVANQKSISMAAIASQEAATLFNLEILKSDITNQSENITRFLVLAKKPIQVALSVQCKTSIAISTGQQAGSLAEVLSLFHEAEIPLSKLESRPIPSKPWEQMFYIDLEGNGNDPKVQSTLSDLSRICRFLRILGSYPTKDMVATKLPAASLAQVKLASQQAKEKQIDDKQTEKDLAKQPNQNRAQGRLISRQHKPTNTIIEVKQQLIGGDHFVVIGGPNRLISNEQMLACTSQARETGINIVSTGVIDPTAFHTDAKQNEQAALGYLKQAANRDSLPCMVEITSPNQYKNLAHCADILQLSAANMQNQTLIKLLGHVNRPVMLRRDPIASIEQLLSAAESILSLGNQQVFLCEQGVRTIENQSGITLDLSAVVLLKNLTHLPILVDPTYAAHDIDELTALTIAAKSVGAQGVIIEFDQLGNAASNTNKTLLDFSSMTQLMSELHTD